MTKFAKFLCDDAGAITVDWISVTAGILLLGIMVIFTIFNSDGVDNLISNSNANLGGTGPSVTVGPMPTFNDGGTDDGSGGDDSEPCVGFCG